MSESTQKPRLSDKVEQKLLRRIHSGDLPVGAKLPSEPELAVQMGISRGILREALSSLQSKGYISRTQRSGSYIAQTMDDNIGQTITANVRTADIKDLIEFREAIESKTVQLAIDRATDEEIASLHKLIENTDEQMTDNIDYYFHYRIAELSGNPLFVVFLDMYYDSIHRYAEGSYKDAARRRVMQREHMRILNAIEKHDKRAAVAAIKGHLRNALQRASGDWDVYI